MSQMVAGRMCFSDEGKVEEMRMTEKKTPEIGELIECRRDNWGSDTRDCGYFAGKSGIHTLITFTHGTTDEKICNGEKYDMWRYPGETDWRD